MPLPADIQKDLLDLHTQTMERAVLRGEKYLTSEKGRQIFTALGLAGEAGEVANLFKKLMRGQKIDMNEIAEEMADTLSYLVMLAHECNIDLDEALREKLKIYRKRFEKGEI